MMADEQRDRILMIVRQIPSGCVATYGQIARLAGIPRHARQVGQVLGSLPSGSAVPWHRVINANGQISSRCNPACEQFQREQLEKEGVEFQGNRIEPGQFDWQP